MGILWLFTVNLALLPPPQKLQLQAEMIRSVAFLPMKRTMAVVLYEVKIVCNCFAKIYLAL